VIRDSTVDGRLLSHIRSYKLARTYRNVLMTYISETRSQWPRRWRSIRPSAFAGNAPLRPEMLRYVAFYRKNRELFAGARDVANVAVLRLTGDRKYKVGWRSAGLWGRIGYYSELPGSRLRLVVRHFFNNPSSRYIDEPAGKKAPPEGFVPKNAIPSIHLIPLEEIIADALGVGTNASSVEKEYLQLVERGGSEFTPWR
jgi:hypothetical protein